MDFPGAAFWLELSRAFPNALVVLSTRAAEAWYESSASTIFQLDDGHESSPFSEVWHERFGFSDRFDDRAAMIAAYERHNDSVRSSVPPSRLLEWTVGDGWLPPLRPTGGSGPRRTVSFLDQYHRRVPVEKQSRLNNTNWHRHVCFGSRTNASSTQPAPHRGCYHERRWRVIRAGAALCETCTMEVDPRACPNCLGTDFHDASCVRCRRPIQLPSESADELERLAWAVVDCVYELYGDLRGTAATGSDLDGKW